MKAPLAEALLRSCARLRDQGVLCSKSVYVNHHVSALDLRFQTQKPAPLPPRKFKAETVSF